MNHLDGRVQATQSFNRVRVLGAVALLPHRHRTAYASACAERMLPLYDWFVRVEHWGDSAALRDAADTAWAWLRGQVSFEAVAAAIPIAEAVTPDTEAFASALASRALDAAAAVAQALQSCLDPSPDVATDAGEIAWECAFGVEQSRLLADGIVVAHWPTLEDAARGKLVKLEEELQRDSLVRLSGLQLDDQAIDGFRERYARLAQ